jgi:hypothetical protein
MLSLAVMMAVIVVAVRGKSDSTPVYRWGYSCNRTDAPVGGHFLGPRWDKQPFKYHMVARYM